MSEKQKRNILNPDHLNVVLTKINTEDFVGVHKAEIKALISDNTALKWGAAIFDKLGAFILGLSTTLWASVHFLPNSDQLEPYSLMAIILFVIGLVITGWGIYVECNRNAKVERFVKEALNEKDLKP